MDLERLTKHQIVLLTLLVSFVTSIATGIVTVALMNQAPPSVTHTINQIVERTVQTIAAPSQGAAVVTEKTVVVNNDDLVAQSIAAVQKSIIRITVRGGQDLITRGVFIDSKGTALTDEGALMNSSATDFDAILSDGTRVPVTFSPSQATSTSLAVISVAVGTSTGWAPAVLGDPTKVALGQSVIRIGGTGQDTVDEGVIATLPSANDPSIVEASVPSATPGAVLINLFGDVIGMTTMDSLTHGDDFYTIPPSAAAPATTTPATKTTSH